MSNLIKSEVVSLTKSLNLSVDPEEFYSIMAAQCFGGKTPTNGQLASFLALANQYKLNPLTKEIYAFPSGGAIQPIIGIDGWIKIAHSSGDLRGIKHEVITNEQGEVIAVKCIIARDGWEFYTETVEYMSENRRNTQTWKQFPVRMLKHRATAQAIRMAFNVNAMIEDEYEQMLSDQAGFDDVESPSNVLDDIVARARECQSTEQLTELWKSLNKNERALAKDVIRDIGRELKESIVEVQDDQEG